MNDDLDALIERELLDIDDVEVFGHDIDPVENILSLKLSLLNSSDANDGIASSEPSPSTLQLSADLHDHHLNDFISDICVKSLSYDVISGENVDEASLLSKISHSTLDSITERIPSSILLDAEDTLMITDLVDGIISCLERDPFLRPREISRVRVVVETKTIDESPHDQTTIEDNETEEDYDMDNNNESTAQVAEYSYNLSSMQLFDLSEKTDESKQVQPPVESDNDQIVDQSTDYDSNYAEESQVIDPPDILVNLSIHEESDDEPDIFHDRLSRIHQESEKYRKTFCAVSLDIILSSTILNIVTILLAASTIPVSRLECAKEVSAAIIAAEAS
jgi:hypothetical protein